MTTAPGGQKSCNATGYNSVPAFDVSCYCFLKMIFGTLCIDLWNFIKRGLLESRCKGSLMHPSLSSLVDQERMRPLVIF